MKDAVAAIATALMFLTRLPVGRWASGDSAVLGQSTQYFPLVGVVVGGLAACAFTLASLLWPASVAVAITLLFAVMLTGGFHEDGLADLADSAGAWTIEKRLEIMRDSRVGTYGALALVLMLLIKYQSLLLIADQHLGVAAVTLVLAHVVARWSSLPLIRYTIYARSESDNKAVAEAVTDRRLGFGSMTTLLVVLLCVPLLGGYALATLPMAVVIVYLARRWFLHKLAGVTGDCLGATNAVTETCVYLLVSAGTFA